MPGTLSNAEIARTLDVVADLLAAQHANLYRIRGWRNAADVLRHLDVSAADLIAHGASIPDVGHSMNSAIKELVRTGRLRTLERLEGEVNPEQLLATVPGLGEELAHRVHDQLGILTLEELEAAAHDGRLESLPGFGERRTRMVRSSLAGMLARTAGHAPRGPHHVPDVGVLLEIDAEYRRRAEAGDLPTIAPRRFNTRREKWLPILHAERGGHEFTALFSNTARAHELGKTREWVVLYWDRGGDDGQCTVVTETHGPLAGLRVVRGRERECREHYDRLREEAGPLHVPAWEPPA